MKRGNKGICLAAGGCFMLGLLLRTVPGIRFSSTLCVGLGALLLIWLALRLWSEKSTFGKWCKRIFLVSISAAFLVLSCLEAAIIWYSVQENENERVDAVIVLGAGVNGTTPSLVLQSRIDAAARYLKAHPDIPAVLSGGQGPGEDITEAQAMYHGLVAQGIAPERLLLEERSTNTRENLRYSMVVLIEHGFDTHADRTAVVTNGFHALRAVAMDWDLPLQRVAVRAELPWWLDVNYHLREAFAIVKNLIFD